MQKKLVEGFRFTDFMCRGTNTGAMMGAAHVVTTSVGMCDVDLRCLFVSL